MITHANADFTAMRKCSKFRRCNASICPLDPLQDRRIYFAGEPKCRQSKAKRMKLARLYLAKPTEQLPRRGMTKAEWGGTRHKSKRKATSSEHRSPLTADFEQAGLGLGKRNKVEFHE